MHSTFIINFHLKEKVAKMKTVQCTLVHRYMEPEFHGYFCVWGLWKVFLTSGSPKMQFDLSLGNMSLRSWPLSPFPLFTLWCNICLVDLIFCLWRFMTFTSCGHTFLFIFAQIDHYFWGWNVEINVFYTQSRHFPINSFAIFVPNAAPLVSKSRSFPYSARTAT